MAANASFCRFIGAAIILPALGAVLAGPVHAQRGPAANPGQVQPRMSGAHSTPGVDPVTRAYELSKGAKTEVQFTNIIKICQQSLAGRPSEKQAAYARKLESWAHNKRGELLADAGQDDEALGDFQTAIKLDSTNWRALHNRGVSYASRTQFAEAAADFDEVIRAQPNFASAWFNRGELRSQNNDFAGAIGDYDQALKLHPKDPAALVGRGHALYQLGKNTEALESYDKSLEMDDQRANTYLYRAAALAEAGRYAEAATDYRSAVRLEPKSAASYQAAAWLMSTCPDDQFRDPKLAVKAARKAISLRDGEDARDQETLAAALAADGDFAGAVAAQRRAISLVPAQQKDLRQTLEAHLKLYEQKQPYREARRVAPEAETKR